MLHTSGQALPPALKIREALPPFLPNRTEDRGWTNLRTNKLGRDLDYTQWRRHVDLSFYLYRTNPLAHRIIEMDVAFIIGPGVTLQTTSEPTKKVINDFWKNRYNRWDRHLYRRIRDLLIYGEWFHAPVATKNGQVFINSFQPTLIYDTIVSPFSHEYVDSVMIRNLENGQIVERRIPIIRPNFNESTEELDGYVGDAFLFGINQTTDATRGIGELYTLVDGLDVYEEMIFNRAEKVAQASSVWWDLQLEGFNQEQIDEFLKHETDKLPPKSGTVWGHNEKAILKAQFPNTEADQHDVDVRTQKSHLVSSAGFPGTFFDEPGTAGRAVGAEMSEPTFKTIKSLQGQITGFLREEIDYSLDVAIKSRLNDLTAESVDWDYEISFGSPNARDIQRIGPAMFRLVQAAAAAVGGQFMTKQQAATLLAAQINQLGLSDMPMRIEKMFEDPELANIVKNKLADKPQRQMLPGGQPGPQTSRARTPMTQPQSSQDQPSGSSSSGGA